MKIFFTLDTLLNAGTEKSTLDIVRNFSNDTEVIVIYFYPGHDLKEEYKKAGIKLIFLDLNGKYSFFKGILRLNKLIRIEKPDLIVSSIARSNIISRISAKLTSIPVVGTFVNDSYGQERISEHKKKGIYLGFRFFWQLDKLTSFIPKYWISNSKSIAFSNAAALNIPADKIKIIYRGRNSEKIPLWHTNISESKNFNFIFIGRLLNRKGIMDLINAFRQIIVDFPNAKLHIYGTGELEKSIQDFINNNNLTSYIILYGSILNAWRKMYDAHCFVFPSHYEGFSGALIEAMMVGIPIIASDIPMNLEAIQPNQTALVHKSKDVNDLVSKMKDIVLNYPQMIEMGIRAREEALNRFDIKLISSQYELFLQQIFFKLNSVK